LENHPVYIIDVGTYIHNVCNMYIV